MNAEATAGGFPGWVTTGAYGSLRNNDSRYTDAWTPYFSKMSEIVAKHQVTNGGSVFIYQIENEYGDQWTNVAKKTPDHPAIQYSKYGVSDSPPRYSVKMLCSSSGISFSSFLKIQLLVFNRKRVLTSCSGTTRGVC